MSLKYPIHLLLLLLAWPILSFGQKREPEKVIPLKGVWVKAKLNRFTQKNDTLTIHITENDYRPHASAKTLFERIHGLDIGFGGNVKMLGKPVQQVTVDGRTIFGGVAYLTLDNIRADMIERMEFVETTDASGKTQNTLNLTLKESRKNGAYGDIGAGIGSKSRYALNGNYSKLTENGFFNAFVSANSLNENGFDPKTINRLLTTNFINSINRSSSVIGLYEIDKQNFQNEIEKLDKKPEGINKVIDAGLNYTFQTKKLEFNGFLYGKYLQERNLETKHTSYFFGTNNQNTKEVSEQQNKPISLTENANLTWKPTQKMQFRFEEQLHFNQGLQRFSQNQNRGISDSQLIMSNTHFSNSKALEFQNNFQVNGIIKGNKPGEVGTVYYKNTIYRENRDIDFINSSSAFLQNQAIKRQHNAQLNTLQLTYSKPLKKGFLFESKAKYLYEVRYINQETTQSNLPAINQNIESKLTNKLGEIDLYALYKKRRFTFISGLSFWHWNINRSLSEQSFNSKKGFILNPFTRIEYKMPNVRFALKYDKEPRLPTWQETIHVPDSSNLFSISIGNPLLNFYTQNEVDLSMETDIYKGYQMGIQASYKKYDDFVISNNTFIPVYGVFGRSFINSPHSAQDLSLNLRLFRVNPLGSFSWFLLAGLTQINTLQKTEENITSLHTSFAFISYSFSWKATQNLSLKTELKSQLNSVQKAFQSTNYLISNLILDLGKKSYFEAESSIQMYKYNGFSTQSFIDIEFGRYLLKNDAVKMGLIVKNLLNNKNELTLLQNENLYSQTYKSTLPFTLLMKLTYYPEFW